ncbi:UNVERIFIED_CONTAM: hypothetical protein GTU68_024922 [Idotea baltica]|nr:hypothetical protein [Idotea baltica]
MELGVDVVVHSTTKYLNGHSDVVGGCVITKHQPHADRVSEIVNTMGLGCSPFDAWLVLRGIKTLGPRMEAHQRGAMAVAQMLDAHSNVDRVYFPGLQSHPHHELGDAAFAEKVMTNLNVFQLAESLGGVESLVEYPETMSHASITAEARREAGISDRTIRVSVGIEHPDDLVADMKAALES